MLRQVGSAFLVNKFYNDMKSQGFSVGKMTIHDYLSYIEDAYLCLTVPLFTESARKAQANPRKVYAVDPGVVTSYAVTTSENLGHLFENVVCLALRRRGYEVFYYLTQERYEVDFVARGPDRRLHLYQVVWDDRDKETMTREKRALAAAEQELKVTGEIITPEVFLTW